MGNFYLERTMSKELNTEAVGQVSCRNCRRQVPRTACIAPTVDASPRLSLTAALMK